MKEIKITNYKNENNMSLRPIEVICETKKHNNTLNLSLMLPNQNNIPKLSFNSEISISKNLFDENISNCKFVKLEDTIKKTEFIKEVNFLNEFKKKLMKNRILKIILLKKIIY